MFQRDRVAPIDLQEISYLTRAGHIFQQVVRDSDPLCFLAGCIVVPAQNIKAGAVMAHDVVCDLDIFDCAPRGPRVLVAHGDHECRHPNPTFQNISVDNYAPRVLQLQCAFYGRAALPLRGFEKIVASNLDIRRHQVL